MKIRTPNDRSTPWARVGEEIATEST
ncbi:hypothetical protein DSM3645_03133 [Blastopirellula marina DSM 3645]|uniref:Uncharacterized protein n=1 Tax=Blastopirellula marina DSM 3645 TaxID=314230 RepID=A3ZVU0_9BACT|nr:hypothetical protein DSM3645_03133 [Blastopirellula marina DSM 3645]